MSTDKHTNGRITITMDLNTMQGAGFNAYAPPQGQERLASYLRKLANAIEQGERTVTLAHPNEARGEGARDIAARMTFRPTKYKRARFVKVAKF